MEKITLPVSNPDALRIDKYIAEKTKQEQEENKIEETKEEKE